MRGTVLIAGATGVVGQAALAHFAGLGSWHVVALSRRTPAPVARGVFRHLALDLGDAAACRAAVAALPEVTHLVYAALHERPDLVRGWRTPEQMAANAAMLRHLLAPLCDSAKGLRHVILLQGTKAYGAHLHRIAVPAKETAPRDAHENFYWLQEDELRAAAAAHGFAFTIFRPQVIFGDALGVAMNLIPVLGAYAAICRADDRPFAFPGGPSYVLEAVDARLLAKALAWAAEAAAARNEIFNITNGDVFVWRSVWPAIADALGVATGPDAPLALADFLPRQAALWDRIVERHGLRPLALSELLGQSHQYADFLFAHGAREPPPPVLVSTIKLRQAGFADCLDTEDMFRDWFRILVERRILPRPG